MKMRSSDAFKTRRAFSGLFRRALQIPVLKRASSAISVFIARGYAVEKAVEKAKQFVDSMLKTAMPVGKNKTMLYFQF